MSDQPKPRRLQWLVDPNRGVLLPITGLWILALDWLLFSSNALSLGLATPIIVLLGFILGGAGTYFMQKRIARDTFWRALSKALIAGIVVGIPWPLTGSIIGGWVLLASGLRNSKDELARKS